ncbi:cysteine desulfuration protein SufE [Prosthecobacter fusiformis]|uniref:Cysteine desulfuration protein SufE n=1 Tax=Prosthecobacter fusiformis TaxID=48464 RepID=A0A4R7S4F9_9BACT|nr:SufE family protein [Prosthecobacter fusiformis]TDU73312.1 cysteine desulfuration protein SufE [Prosthecobacter fusiformis]
MSYPTALNEIIQLFEFLPEAERRDLLINYSEAVAGYARNEESCYDLEDVRKDEECTDTVGVFLRVDDAERVSFAIELGPKVQTLTKAMTVILCRGLNGSTLAEVLAVPADFVPRIIGADLVRLRSQTVYYVLGRMKKAAKMYVEQNL